MALRDSARERFHDLRHTTATLLLKIGTPLAVVQRLVGHSDPAITTEICGHLEAEDARVHLEKLSFAPLPAEPEPTAEAPAMVMNAPRAPPVPRPTESAKNKAPGAPAFASNSEGFKWSGRQDSNLRPLGPERPRDGLHALTEGGLASHPVEIADDTSSQDLHTAAPNASLSSRRGAPVVRNFGGVPEELLSVPEVARVLGLSRATIYKLVERGELAHHRISNAVRIAPTDLDELFQRCQRAKNFRLPS